LAAFLAGIIVITTESIKAIDVIVAISFNLKLEGTSVKKRNSEFHKPRPVTNSTSDCISCMYKENKHPRPTPSNVPNAPIKNPQMKKYAL